jgi:hypothetical protein
MGVTAPVTCSASVENRETRIAADDTGLSSCAWPRSVLRAVRPTEEGGQAARRTGRRERDGEESETDTRRMAGMSISFGSGLVRCLAAPEVSVGRGQWRRRCRRRPSCLGRRRPSSAGSSARLVVEDGRAVSAGWPLDDGGHNAVDADCKGILTELYSPTIRMPRSHGVGRAHARTNRAIAWPTQQAAVRRLSQVTFLRARLE